MSTAKQELEITIEEDIALTGFAEERLKEEGETLTHDEVWNDV